MTMWKWMTAGVLMAATPAVAGYKLMPQGVPETVRASALVVTTASNW